jgi:colanic acid/amylovoran biosynthesis protein
MIVEVRGVNTRNKGAELMLRTVEAKLRGKHELAVDPRAGDYLERARLGLLQKVGHPFVKDPVVTRALGLLPRKGRSELRRYGLVTDADIGAVLDGSGFAYSDQFDLKRSEIAAGKAERARAAGKPYILLPQAFGPFEDPARRAAFVRLANASTHVYARERASLDFVLASGCRTDHVSLAPDFTNLLPGRVPADFEVEGRLALLVPSAKLLTETTPAVSAAYLPFMADAAALLGSGGFDVRIVLHERMDTETIAALQDRLPARLPVIADPDPLALKGIIGQAAVVVGSRFHALVSALSQGVPALGIGWSHKYQMLFEDYGLGRMVVDPTLAGPELAALLEQLTGPSAGTLRRELLQAAEDERVRSAAMWSDVEAMLEGRSVSARRPA